MTLAQILAVLGGVLTTVGTIIMSAVRLGRAYGSAEAKAAQLLFEVSELREQVRKWAARTGALERQEGRRP